MTGWSLPADSQLKLDALLDWLLPFPLCSSSDFDWIKRPEQLRHLTSKDKPIEVSPRDINVNNWLPFVNTNILEMQMFRPLLATRLHWFTFQWEVAQRDSLWLFNQKGEEGTKQRKRNLWSQERKYSMKNNQESLGWGWRFVWEKSIGRQRQYFCRKYFVIRQLEYYIFHGKYAYNVKMHWEKTNL